MNDWLVLNPQPVAHLLVGKMASRPAHLLITDAPEDVFPIENHLTMDNGQNNHLKKIYQTTIWVDVSPIEDWCIFQPSPCDFIRLQECTSWPAGWAHVLMDVFSGDVSKKMYSQSSWSIAKYDLNLRINMMSSAKRWNVLICNSLKRGHLHLWTTSTFSVIQIKPLIQWIQSVQTRDITWCVYLRSWPCPFYLNTYAKPFKILGRSFSKKKRDH